MQRGRDSGDSEELCCWETVAGQELYKLTLTHLLADVAKIVLVDALRWALGRLKCWGKLQSLVHTLQTKDTGWLSLDVPYLLSQCNRLVLQNSIWLTMC